MYYIEIILLIRGYFDKSYGCPESIFTLRIRIARSSGRDDGVGVHRGAHQNPPQSNTTTPGLALATAAYSLSQFEPKQVNSFEENFY